MTSLSHPVSLLLLSFSLFQLVITCYISSFPQFPSASSPQLVSRDADVFCSPYQCPTSWYSSAGGSASHLLTSHVYQLRRLPRGCCFNNEFVILLQPVQLL